MENIPIPATPAGAPPVSVCPVCHFPMQPEFYFCPNCGKPVKEKPLSISVVTQAWIYALSIALPWLAFIFLGYWPGMKYMRAEDERAKQIGIIAAVLMAVSTVIMVWLLIVWTQQLVQSAVNSVGDLSGLGG